MRNLVLVLIFTIVVCSCDSTTSNKYHISEVVLESYESMISGEYNFYPPPDSLCRLKSTRELVTGVVYDSINVDRLEPLFQTEFGIRGFDYSKYIGKYSHKFGENNQLVFSCDYKNGLRNGDLFVYYVGHNRNESFKYINPSPGKVMDYWSNMYFEKSFYGQNWGLNSYLDERGLFYCMSSSKNSNGLLKVKGRYRNGKRVGQWDFYSPDNVLTRTEIHDFPEVKYIDFVEHGPYKGEIRKVSYQNLLNKKVNHVGNGVYKIEHHTELSNGQHVPCNIVVDDRINRVSTEYLDKEMTKVLKEERWDRVTSTSDVLKDEILNLMVTQVNKSCPLKLDDYTTLNSSSSIDNIFTYYYTIDKNILSYLGTSKNDWSKNKTLSLGDFYCNSPEYSVIRENNITVRWKYTDLNGFPFGIIELNNETCN